MTEQTRELEVREKQLNPREGTRPGPTFVPEVDIVEEQDQYLLTADLPGVDESSIQIELKDDVLSIDASLADGPDPSWRPLHEEYRVGDYHRSFAMSDRIDREKIEAQMSDGVLTLHLPKAARHQPRQIQVSRS